MDLNVPLYQRKAGSKPRRHVIQCADGFKYEVLQNINETRTDPIFRL